VTKYGGRIKQLVTDPRPFHRVTLHHATRLLAHRMVFGAEATEETPEQVPHCSIT
jgi:hypothetical protein